MFHSINTQKYVGKAFLYLLFVNAIMSCRATTLPEFSPTPPKNTPTIVATASTIPLYTSSPTTTTKPIEEKCNMQFLDSIEGLSLDGSLVHDHIELIHFPDMIHWRTPKNMMYLDPKISPDQMYIAAEGALYSNNNLVRETIDILAPKGDLVTSIHWVETWRAIIGWTNSKEIVVRTSQPGILKIINPFTNTIRELDLHLSSLAGEKISVVGYAPALNAIAYYYPNDPGEKIRMEIWDLQDQKKVLSTEGLYAPLLSKVAWSSNGSMFAVSTLLLSEADKHSEIMVVDYQGKIVITTNFRSSFPQIQIVDIEWSLNNQKIFFWAWTHDKEVTSESNYDLYSFDISTGEVSKYCVTGDGQNNRLIWLPNMPNLFITENYTLYDVYNNKYEWDVLLVDPANNKAYKLGHNIVPFGWVVDNRP